MDMSERRQGKLAYFLRHAVAKACILAMHQELALWAGLKGLVARQEKNPLPGGVAHNCGNFQMGPKKCAAHLHGHRYAVRRTPYAVHCITV